MLANTVVQLERFCFLVVRLAGLHKLGLAPLPDPLPVGQDPQDHGKDGVLVATWSVSRASIRRSSLL